jgi:hypothetical protein
MPTAHRTEQDMTTPVDRAELDPADDPAIDRRSRVFLKELNKDSSPFWELPFDQAADDCDRAAGRSPSTCPASRSTSASSASWAGRSGSRWSAQRA